MIWWILGGLAVLAWSLCAVASRSDKRIAVMRCERAYRLYRVANGTATEQDYADTLHEEVAENKDGVGYSETGGRMAMVLLTRNEFPCAGPQIPKVGISEWKRGQAADIRTGAHAE